VNCVISVIKPAALDALCAICEEQKLPITMITHGRGTATRNMLNLLGIDSREKRVVINIATREQTKALIQAQKRQLYIGIPGNGIIAAVPRKSVGGGKTLAYLNGGGPVKKEAPDLRVDYEMIMVIANEGYIDDVMDAARAAGASGGTVLHAKGTGSQNDEKFFNVSIVHEKEVVMIVAKTEKKAAIMSSILKNAGPETDAGAIVFSLPVSELAGLPMLNDEPEHTAG